MPMMIGHSTSCCRTRTSATATPANSTNPARGPAKTIKANTTPRPGSQGDRQPLVDVNEADPSEEDVCGQARCGHGPFQGSAWRVRQQQGSGGENSARSRPNAVGF